MIEFAAGTDGLDLLQAAEAAAHARGKNHEIVAHGRRIPHPEARRQPILQPPEPQNNRVDLAGRTRLASALANPANFSFPPP